MCAYEVVVLPPQICCPNVVGSGHVIAPLIEFPGKVEVPESAALGSDVVEAGVESWTGLDQLVWELSCAMTGQGQDFVPLRIRIRSYFQRWPGAMKA